VLHVRITWPEHDFTSDDAPASDLVSWNCPLCCVVRSSSLGLHPYIMQYLTLRYDLKIYSLWVIYLQLRAVDVNANNVLLQYPAGSMDVYLRKLLQSTPDDTLATPEHPPPSTPLPLPAVLEPIQEQHIEVKLSDFGFGKLHLVSHSTISCNPYVATY
jgi:hypothetical protein